MMNRHANWLVRKCSVRATAMLLAGFLSSTVAVLPMASQAPSTPPAKPAKAGAPSRYHPTRFPKRAESFYGVVWGLDSLSVKAVESGALIRFSYRILDPEKAKILNDKKFDAFLDAPSRNVRLSIPSLEKVGQLRQANAEQSGKTYWMAFSNPRRTVKPGDHVNIVIGTFHANGLVVD
jgi:hypothetical protein